MSNNYTDVSTRFLRDDERFVISEEKDMPLVIEPKAFKDVASLQTFLTKHSVQICEDIATYGAVLLRGFDVATDEDFENTVLSIRGFQGISDAFMSEHGRTHVGNLKYVLHTNAVYKTGGTLYLGGFHSENYYSPDVPSYLCFCCLRPSDLGGETGLINMEKIYSHLDEGLKERLNKHYYFVAKWLVSEVAKRYQTSEEIVEKVCAKFDLPIIGTGKDRFVLMYKPSIFEHPVTKKRAVQINYFEVAGLNEALRKCFIADYKGKAWFWHRLAWRMPPFAFTILETLYMSVTSLLYSPKVAFRLLLSKFNTFKADKKHNLPEFNDEKVGSCFNEKNVEDLAHLMHRFYCSCLWQRGDIILVDNRKVVHAGMPGAGDRLIRAMICTPLEMRYSLLAPGEIPCTVRAGTTVGHYMTHPNELKNIIVKEESTDEFEKISE